MIDLIQTFLLSNPGIIIISSAVSSITSVLLSKKVPIKLTKNPFLDLVISAIIIAIITFFVVIIPLGLLNFIFNTGLMKVPEFINSTVIHVP